MLVCEQPLDYKFTRAVLSEVKIVLAEISQHRTERAAPC